MGRNTLQPTAHDPLSAAYLHTPAGPPGEGEQLAPSPGECAEGFAAVWETAWIDLGGEG